MCIRDRRYSLIYHWLVPMSKSSSWEIYQIYQTRSRVGWWVIPAPNPTGCYRMAEHIGSYLWNSRSCTLHIKEKNLTAYQHYNNQNARKMCGNVNGSTTIKRHATEEISCLQDIYWYFQTYWHLFHISNVYARSVWSVCLYI